ncbi:alpha/beta hydrolase [Priestia megaterium]|uniref:alpha/beta hydrolase n=1 Tax=Priestia megaterium TaxID=1404 RepID=UPI0007625EEC|nr:alpha/beta hydrolase-fold protein [Priestia megaterium]KWU63913.1 hypothetical protein AWX17_01520 [Priestia megaterium]
MTGPNIITVNDFYSTYLNNKRNLYIYLPPSYKKEKEKYYPVLYMHDGQNIFHKAAINGQSWEIHLEAERLIKEGHIEEIIIVGISNMHEERAEEYSYHTLDISELNIPQPLATKTPKGEFYEQFVVEEVKPYIDSIFRTKKEARHTALMGSSRGGAVTYHMGFRRPDVFGMLGILSPYFCYVDPKSLSVFPLVESYTDKKEIYKVWMDVGEQEGLLIMVDHVKQVAKKLIAAGYEYGKELVYYQDPDASHTEGDWAKRISSPLIYFFGNKGKLESIELTGRSSVGLNESKCSLNLIKSFSSGFKMSELNGAFSVTDERIAEVESNGRISPKKVGKTTISFEENSLRCEKEIEIVEYMPDKMVASLQVRSVEDISEVTTIYAGLPLKMVQPNLYYGTFILPIDVSFSFQIHTDTGKVEVSTCGEPLSRNLHVTKPVDLSWTVSNWK